MFTEVNRPEQLEELRRRFLQMYGEGGVTVLRAPARINILGEHVDYVSYLPTASLAFGSHEHAMMMAFRPTGDAKVRGASFDARFAPFEFTFDETQAPARQDKSWEEFVFNRPVPAPHWSNYVKGAVSFARWKFGASIKTGFEFLIDSTIPASSGASSSSALVVLAAAAIRQANLLSFELSELAQDSSQAEWFLGTRGGSLDHAAICLAKHNRAVHLSYADNCAETISLPSKHFRWVTFFTHAADKGREVMLEYNERAAVSRLIIPALLRSWEIPNPHWFIDWRYAVALLRDGALKTPETLKTLIGYLPETMSLDELGLISPKAFRDCEAAFPALVAERSSQRLSIRSRALHHLGEVWRVKKALDILQSAQSEEDSMRQLGELINQTHDSLRDLYGVSTPEVEHLIELLRSDSKVFGARLMGGGFGGNVLALTTADNVSKLVEQIQQGFYSPQHRDAAREGAVMISTPGNGFSEVPL
ncbi:MAG: hypothetical protein JST85_17570 [Acidobacteria bacterium]|nr:hypothetical protein [Acidobacteriota bacterium]